MLIFTDNNEFVGFAINNQIRGKGYGGRALQILRETYINKRIILNIETTKQISVEDKGETYDMLISGGTIEKEEYRKLLIFTMGKFLFWFMEPKVVLNP